MNDLLALALASALSHENWESVEEHVARCFKDWEKKNMSERDESIEDAVQKWREKRANLGDGYGDEKLLDLSLTDAFREGVKAGIVIGHARLLKAMWAIARAELPALRFSQNDVPPVPDIPPGPSVNFDLGDDK